MIIILLIYFLKNQIFTIIKKIYKASCKEFCKTKLNIDLENEQNEEDDEIQSEDIF